MKWNVLCQSPVSERQSAADAIQKTVRLAVEAEAWGYHRFWCAEHHSDPALAGSAPEIMVAHIAAHTSRLVVGTGGVQLPFYAPLKVAEQFRTLAALHPDRIDLGLGRSGGSEGRAPDALGMNRSDPWARIDELLGWLSGRELLERTFASPRDVPSLPTPWMLGTSPASARAAGERGLPYAFGGFLDPRSMMPCLETYHQSFRPSRWSERPKVTVAWYVQAATTEERARAMTRSSEHWFVNTFARGRCEPFPDPAGLASASYTAMEQMLLQMRRSFALVGTGEQVVEGLRDLQRRTAADELTLVTIPFSHDDRLASYRLIAEAAQLAPTLRQVG